MDFIAKLHKYPVFKMEYIGADTAYHRTVQRIDFVCGMMGINFSCRKYRIVNPVFGWGFSLLFIYVYVTLESTYYYRNDIEKALSCITTFGFSTQMASKVYSFIVLRTKIIEIHEMNVHFFSLEIIQDKTVKQAFKASATLKNILLTLTIYGYCSLVGIIALTPVFYALITSKQVLSFGFEVVHSDSWTAYIINSFFQVNCAYFVVILTTVTDGTFISYILTATGQIDAICDLLKELNYKVELKLAEREIDYQLQKIIQLYQHHQLFMRQVENQLNLYFLISIASLCSNMSISLAAVVLIKWYLGILVFCFASAQIFFMCFLGTHYDTKSEFLNMELGSLCWYNLSLKNQKSINYLLAVMQNPISLTAILEELNVAAYLKIHKTVYSALMLLLRVRS